MAATVTKLHDNKVFESIQQFIQLVHHSEQTKETYERGIRDFFLLIKKKEIEYLTVNDLAIEKKDVEAFRIILRKKGFSNNTINNKVSALRRLYFELKANKLVDDVDFFHVIKKLKDDANSYDAFTLAEAYQLVELALEEKNNALGKSLLILFAVDTCIRKTAALNLKWSNFTILNDKEVKIDTVDKGNTDFRAKIHYDFYQELLKLKRWDSEYVFNFSSSSVDKMMRRLVGKLEINDGRTLVFHSLRKTGVTFVYRYTGDIKAAQRAANHADPSLTIKTYVEEEDYGLMGAVSVNYQKEENILEQLNPEQLRKLLKETDKDIILRLTKQAKEMYFSDGQ